MRYLLALSMLLGLLVGCAPSDPVKNLEWHISKLIKKQSNTKEEIRQAEDTEGVKQVLQLADRDEYERARQAQQDALQDARTRMNKADKDASDAMENALRVARDERDKAMSDAQGERDKAISDAEGERDKAISDAIDKLNWARIKDDKAGVDAYRPVYNGIQDTFDTKRKVIQDTRDTKRTEIQGRYEKTRKEHQEAYGVACKANHEAYDNMPRTDIVASLLQKKQTWYKVAYTIDSVYKCDVRKTDSLTTPAVANVRLSCQVSCSNLFTTKEAAAKAQVGKSRGDEFALVFGYQDDKWEFLPEATGHIERDSFNIKSPEGPSLFNLLFTMND